MFCGCLGKKLSTLISCERALHLGDKVKTGRARGAREQTRKRGVRGGGGCPRAARFVCSNRRAYPQASTLRTLLPLASGSSHDPPLPQQCCAKRQSPSTLLARNSTGRGCGSC